MFYNIVQFIIKLYKWFPILWKDRDWDDFYILEILKYKLKFTRENIAKYSYHSCKEISCKNIKIAELLIDRIQKDNYIENAQQEHEKRWGEFVGEATSIGCGYLLFDNKFSNLGKRRKNIKSQKDWEQEFKENSKIYKHATYMKKQDLKYLFIHLNKHIQKWWC